MVLLAFLTVLFAACSMIYELFLAQTLTSVLGGTNLRYAVTIGLYITSMGCGALLMDPLTRLVERLVPTRTGTAREDSSGPAGHGGSLPIEALVIVEVALMAAGCLAIPYVLVFDRMTAGGTLGSLLAWVRTVALHAPIVIIGVLSGLELPLLMRCARGLRLRTLGAARPGHEGAADGYQWQQQGFAAAFDPRTMAWDYVGTVVGAVLFPFVMLPRWGVVGVAALNVMGNAWGTLLAVLLLGGHCSRARKVSLALAALSFVVLSWLVLSHREAVETQLIDHLYLPESAP